jgi:hypothetical protein
MVISGKIKKLKNPQNLVTLALFFSQKSFFFKNLTALIFGHQVAKFNKVEFPSKFFPVGKDHYLFIYL